MPQQLHTDSNQAKPIDGVNGSASSSPSPLPSNGADTLKAKSCKGCLYYSSNFKANSRSPLCVGLPRSLPNAPPYLTGQSNVEMDASKEKRSLTDFRYACVGYSLYLDHKGQSPSGNKAVRTELPACVGLEVLVDRRAHAADSTSDHSKPIHSKEDGNVSPQRRPSRPTDTTNGTSDDFIGRFRRNAAVVANGVVKNLRKVGNQIKQNFDDIVSPYRGRPK